MMVKAKIRTQDGRTAVFIGLSFGNLDNFRKGPMDSFIQIKSEELGIPIDIVLFSGETEEQMADALKQQFFPQLDKAVGPRQ